MKSTLNVVATLILLIPAGSEAQTGSKESTHMDKTTEPNGIRDFDPVFGEWSVQNRRLKVRFAGSNDWDEFPGHLKVRPILKGTANTDEIDFPTKGFTGGTLRLFNRKTKDWSIYWMTDRDGTLDPPVVGHFEAGRGVFYGDDVDDGKPIRVRFIWSGITATSAHWEQAFSLDKGQTWETNWTMEMTRTGN
jgi:hypothetical protein